MIFGPVGMIVGCVTIIILRIVGKRRHERKMTYLSSATLPVEGNESDASSR